MSPSAFDNTLKSSGRRGRKLRFAGALASLRLLINYMLMTSLLTAFRLDWGTTLQWLFGIERAASGGMPPMTSCFGLGIMHVAWFMMASPFVLLALPGLAIGATWLVTQLRRRVVGGAFTIFGARPTQVYSNAVVALAFMFWPSCVQEVLVVLDCSVTVDGVSYVASDLSVRCDTAAYRILAAVAWTYLCTLVPAFPIGLFVLMHRNQDRLEEDGFKRRFAFLFDGYSARPYKFEPPLHGRPEPVQLLLTFCSGWRWRWRGYRRLFMSTLAELLDKPILCALNPYCVH